MQLTTEKRKFRRELATLILCELVRTGAPRQACAEGAVAAAWLIAERIETENEKPATANRGG